MAPRDIRVGTKLNGDGPWDDNHTGRLGPLPDLLVWLEQAGIGFIEYSCGEHPNVDSLLEQARLCRDLSLGTSLHPYVRHASPDGFGIGPVRELACGLMDVASEMAQIAGAPQRVVLHGGLTNVAPYRATYDLARRRTRDYFAWLADELDAHYPDVRVFCETAMPTRPEESFGRLGDTYDACLDLVGRCDLPVCWDFGHVYLAVLYGKCDPKPPGDFLARVGHVHAHDVVLCDDGVYRDHAMPPGVGECPIDDFTHALAGVGFDGWVLFESFIYNFESRAEMAAKVVKPGLELLSVLRGNG